MKKTIIVASASIASLLSINTATAADSWTGLYGGLSVGYQDGQLKGENGPLLNYYGITNPDPRTPIAGLFGGYNYQVPQSSVVAGIEASVDFGGEKYTRDSDAVPGNPQAKVEENYEAALKAKLGYAASYESYGFLPYVEAGIVGADTKFNISDDDGTDVGTHKFSPGWVAGVGVDYALQSNIFLRANYSYTRLANTDYLDTAGEFDHRFTLDDYKVGVGYKF